MAVNEVLFLGNTLDDIKRQLQSAWGPMTQLLNSINRLYAQDAEPTPPNNTLGLWIDTDGGPKYYLTGNFGGTVKSVEVVPQVDHGGLAGLADDDHTQYVRHALSTAANDFLVGSGSNTFVKKTLAETRTILFQKARAYRNAAQALTGPDNNKIGLDTDSFDSATITDLTNNRITPTLPGYYKCCGNIRISDLPTTKRAVALLYLNGAMNTYGTDYTNSSGGNLEINITAADLIYCDGVDDYIELYVYVTANCNLSVANAYGTNFLSVVGPF